MTTSESIRRAALTLAVALVLPLLLAACGKTVGEMIDDATITARVKTALLNDPQVAGMKIDVDTTQGVVTMSVRFQSPPAPRLTLRLTYQACTDTACLPPVTKQFEVVAG